MIGIRVNNNRSVSLAKLAARVFVGVCLVFSFFASLVPLSVSAARDPAAMACCAGKPQHCHSGLFAKRQIVRRPEPLCGLKPAAESGRASSGEVADEVSGDEITIIASAAEQSQQSTAPQASITISQQGSTGAALDASFVKSCPSDCCASTTGVVRQPKPRETALANRTQLVSPPQAHRNNGSFNKAFDSNFTLAPTSPRGPPLSVC